MTIERPPESVAPATSALPEAELLEVARERSIALLERNLTPHGILAATPGARANARGYMAIFARDAAVCAIGMALSGSRELEDEAATGLLTIAASQAPNGQMPKFVDVRRSEADFWYLGCIDATLWWLIGLAFLDGTRPEGALRRRLGDRVRRAIDWLACQEHQRFHLVQQNEASDWADIMPRSGFVLYTNALWHLVKRLYDLPHGDDSRRSANELFHPFGGAIAEYRRARLLTHFVRRRARNRELFLSFVNFAQFGDEGDTFGNVLAILCGLADDAARLRTLRALERAGVNEPYPVRVVCEPIPEASLLWRPYMSRHRQNYVWQYHNGGVWPFVGGFWVAALAESGLREKAGQELVKLARANALDDWSFNEWLHGRTFVPSGMRGQSWNAAAFLIAQHAVASRRPLFAVASA
ncbi:MAG TPA: glycoside hydrolase 100 family protein [Burkholderiales bacterium]|nr:glycoside hydrolase 100 family protein [Burkholderiales bacterium]